MERKSAYNCYICNREEKCHSEVNAELKPSVQDLSKIFTRLFSLPLDDDDDYVDFTTICSKCSNQLIEYQQLEDRLLELKSSLIDAFNKKSNGYGESCTLDNGDECLNIAEHDVSCNSTDSRFEGSFSMDRKNEQFEDTDNRNMKEELAVEISERFLESSDHMVEITTENEIEKQHQVQNDPAKLSIESGNVSQEESKSSKCVTLVGTVFDCRICMQEENEEKEEGFDAKSVMRHLKSKHNIRVHICEICGAEFKKRIDLTNHRSTLHFLPNVEELACEQCNCSFTNSSLLRVHKKLHYTSAKFSCFYCEKKFNSENLLQEHVNMHTGNRPYQCINCPKDFASKYTLNAHLKTHSNRPRPFGCEKCPKAFYSLQNLQQHEKSHTGVKDFFCGICKKAFGTQHNLDVHKVVHSGYKPFICRTCGKAFARRAEINDHERTHTGEKPFVCDVCLMPFAQRSNLTTHKRTTHLNEKRYKCEICDRTFKRKRLVDYHIRATHTGERPFKCEICSATFVYPEHFKKHLKIHTGQKPFCCEVCGKSFNSRDNRNAHRFIHSVKKPYECLVCGQGFMRKPLLYSHMQSSGHVNNTFVVNKPSLNGKNDPENFIEEQKSDSSSASSHELSSEESNQDCSTGNETAGANLKFHNLANDRTFSYMGSDVEIYETVSQTSFHGEEINSIQQIKIRPTNHADKECLEWVSFD